MTPGVTYIIWRQAGQAQYGDALVFDSLVSTDDHFHDPTLGVSVVTVIPDDEITRADVA